MKQSKFIVLLSLLLIAVMAFSSCQGESAKLPADDEIIDESILNNLVDKDGAGNEGEGEEQTTTQQAVDTWLRYVEFKKPDAYKSGDLKKLFEENENTSISSDYNVPVFLVRTAVYYSSHGEEEPELREYQYSLYSPLYYDTPCFTVEYSATPYEEGVGNMRDFDVITLLGRGGFFCVERTEWVVTELDESVEPAVEIGEWVTTYQYYDARAKALTEKLDAELDFDYTVYNHYVSITLGDKNYAVDFNGNIIKEFKPGFEYRLPNLAKADFAIDGLYYYVDDGEISVVNSDYELVYARNGETEEYFVLENGNIIVQRVDELADNAESFDLLYAGEKLNVSHYLVNLEENKTEEVELDYIILELYNKYSDCMYFDVKNGNVSQICKYEKGGSFDFYKTLNVSIMNDLSGYDKLPNLIDNQAGMPTLLSPDKFLVERYFGSETVSFTVNKYASVALSYSFNPNYSDFSPYFYEMDNAIYSYSGTKLISEIINTYSFNESLIVETYDSEDGEYTYIICYYDEYYNSARTKTLFTTEDRLYSSYIDVYGNTVLFQRYTEDGWIYQCYATNGTLLFSANDYCYCRYEYEGSYVYYATSVKTVNYDEVTTTTYYFVK